MRLSLTLNVEGTDFGPAASHCCQHLGADKGIVSENVPEIAVPLYLNLSWGRGVPKNKKNVDH